MVKLIKALFLSCLMAAVLTVTLAGAPALAQNNDSYCYMESEDGNVIDLSGICGTNQVPAPDSNGANQAPEAGSDNGTSVNRSYYSNYDGPVSYPTPPRVYNYGQMRAFDEDLYGS